MAHPGWRSQCREEEDETRSSKIFSSHSSGAKITSVIAAKVADSPTDLVTRRKRNGIFCVRAKSRKCDMDKWTALSKF